MINNITNYIKRIFTHLLRTQKNNYTPQSFDITKVRARPRKIYKGINIIPENYDSGKITVLFLEDFKPFIDAILLELKKSIDLSLINIIKADTQYGAINALIALDKITIDFAFCDITLGGMIFDGKSINEHDGIDVFEKIMKNNPKAKVKLLTGHNLNSDKLEITDAISKFNRIVKELNLDISINDVYINKRDSRAKMFDALIQSVYSLQFTKSL